MRLTSEWIMTPFNPTFCIAFASFIAILIVASVALRKKSVQTRQSVLIFASIATLIGYFVYKAMLSADADYDSLTQAMGGFNWWGELPFQLCNINMILIPIAVYRNNRALMSFCFFVAPLGALMALVMPGTGFDGYPLMLPRMLGYYGTHFAIMIEGLALVTFGLYSPRFRDLPKAALTLFVIGLAVFGINMVLRATGLHPKANYFFTVETEGNALLEVFYGWIPYPFLYTIPCMGLLIAYMGLVMLILSGYEHITARRKA